MNKKQIQHQLINKLLSTRTLTFRQIIDGLSKRPDLLEIFYDCTPADFITCVKKMKGRHEIIPSIPNSKEVGARQAFKDKALEYVRQKGLDGDRGVATLPLRQYVGIGSENQSRDLLLEMIDEKLIYKTGYTIDVRYVPYELKDQADIAFAEYLVRKEQSRNNRKPRL